MKRIEKDLIEVEMGEDLTMEFWEILWYMLFSEKVERAIDEFAEKVSF